MPVYLAILLGIVEGVTEYLPVSSTGHLVLVSHWLGLSDDDAANKAFEIVVQLGAILAVVVHYRRLLAARIGGVLSGDPQAKNLFVALAVAFAPAAFIGLVARKAIKAYLLKPRPVAAALVLGGLAMIVIERWLKSRRRPDPERPPGLDDVTPRRALWIGLGQCLSLWPGTSRSMCTILAGELAGLDAGTAAQFSFLLALPTLGAATIYEGIKSRGALVAGVGLPSLAAGLLVSFFVAWGVIAGFIRYLRTRGLEPFGWYRIVFGVLVFWVLRS